MALTVLNAGEYCSKYYEQNPVDESTMSGAADKASHLHHNTLYTLAQQYYYT